MKTTLIFLVFTMSLFFLSCSKDEVTDPCQELKKEYRVLIDEATTTGDLEQADTLRNQLNRLLINRGCF